MLYTTVSAKTGEGVSHLFQEVVKGLDTDLEASLVFRNRESSIHLNAEERKKRATLSGKPKGY
jgi:hypothetical protein